MQAHFPHIVHQRVAFEGKNVSNVQTVNHHKNPVKQETRNPVESGFLVKDSECRIDLQPEFVNPIRRQA